MKGLHQVKKLSTAVSYKSQERLSPQVDYDTDDDRLYVELRDGIPAKSKYIDDHLGIDYDEDGRVIGYGLIGIWQLIKTGSEGKLRVTQDSNARLMRCGGRPKK